MTDVHDRPGAAIADGPGEVEAGANQSPAWGSADWAEGHLAATLARWAINHELLACDPALADTAAFCEAYGIDRADSANTIIVAAKENPPRYVACVLLATCRLDVNRVVRTRLGTRKVSFATAEETRQLTGMEIGGVCPIGLPDGLAIWVDAAVMTRQRIVLGGGSRRLKLALEPIQLQRVPGLTVVEGLAQVLARDGQP